MLPEGRAVACFMALARWRVCQHRAATAPLIAGCRAIVHWPFIGLGLGGHSALVELSTYALRIGIL
jgi:hypothetical protein